MSVVAKLETLRSRVGQRRTLGLTDAQIARFADDPLLQQAVDEALGAQECFLQAYPELMAGPEADAIPALQKGFVNFYLPATVNPYVALSARGPWLVTAWGAVLHDSGGYGMLGFGHGPQPVIDAMSQPYVMANIMTASFSQARFMEKLQAELGHSRGGNPFQGHLCINSGSESVTVAMRIADINAKAMTAPGARHAGKEVRELAVRGAFHGRTDRPAHISHSTIPTYVKHLKSFEDDDGPILVASNDVAGLEAAFAKAEANGVFIQLVAMEPVMGEGNPGQAVTRAFYDTARRLTREHGSMLLVDSVQAGLRAQGTLSIVDYPGFEDCECPDLETWSKALNGGQFPLSVLGMGERAVPVFRVGIYGNTMTTNPRALEVACAVLDLVTPEMRVNVRERGVELVDKLQALSGEFPGVITSVRGTGLLLAAELDPERFPVVGFGGVEEWCRVHGMGVIHGGKNALRYTPHFNITSAEVDLVVELTRDAIVHFLDEEARAAE